MTDAIPPALWNVCFVLCCINVSYFPAAYFSHWWIYDPDGLRHPHRFRQRLGRRPACARRPSGAGLGLGRPAENRARAAASGFSRLFRLALPAAVSVRRLAAGAVSLHGGLHRLGVGEFCPLSRDDARGRRTAVRLAARDRLSDGVQQRSGRAERLSHGIANRRHALSDAGAADPRRDLPRASDLQAAIRIAVSDRADRGLAVEGVLHRRRRRGRNGVRLVARLRHRELAGLLSLDADVLAGLPHRGQGHLVEAAEPVLDGALSRRQRAARHGHSSGC